MKSSTPQLGSMGNLGPAEQGLLAKPLFEGLEERRMMSTVALNGSVLTVTGDTDSPNTVSVTLNDTKIILTAAANATVREFNLSDVGSIQITCGN